MSLNVSVFNPLVLRYGAMPPAPTLGPQVTAQVVALGVPSSAIAGPCLMCLIPDEDQRITASTAVAGAVAPTATGIKLKAGIERWFELGTGSWIISAVAG